MVSGHTRNLLGRGDDTFGSGIDGTAKETSELNGILRENAAEKIRRSMGVKGGTEIGDSTERVREDVCVENVGKVLVSLGTRVGIEDGDELFKRVPFLETM